MATWQPYFSLNKINPELHKLAKSNPEQLVEVAKHEIGHVVIAKLCNSTVKEVALYSQKDDEWIEEGHRGRTRTDDYFLDTFRKLMVHTGGLAGEQIDSDNPPPFFPDLHDGTSGDAKNINNDVFEKSIYPYSVQAHPDFDHIEWVNEAYYQSHQLLRQFRPVFDKLVALLLKKKKLSGVELTSILSKLPRKAPRSKLFTWRTTHKAIEALKKSNPKDPRLNVYKAAKHAQQQDETEWDAEMALQKAKTTYSDARKASDEAQQEILYMLRNHATLIEAKKYLLGKKVKKLERTQAVLKTHRQLPWQQRNYLAMHNLRTTIKNLKADVASYKATLKALN